MSTVALPTEEHFPLNLSGRIPELDGLRGVAIGMVLLYHYFQQTWLTRPGSLPAYLQAAARLTWSGVDLFFVLSGFLIGGILLDARTSTNYFQVFYTRRFFRIIPIYFATLLIFPALLHSAQSMRQFDFYWLSAHPLPWYSYWAFTQNFWMAHAGSFGANGLAITWSLAIEEQFYLTLPLIVRLVSGRWFTACILTGICSAPILRIVMRFMWPENWISRFVLMPCRADALLLGVLAAILLRDLRWRKRIEGSRLPFAIILSIFIFGIAYLTVRAPSAASPLMGDIGYTWLALFYVCVLLFALAQPNSLLSRSLRVKWLGWLGSIAYGTYLIHEMIDGMIFGIVWRHDPNITGGYTLLTSLFALFITLVIARLSWRYFENPLIRVGHRSGYKFEVPRTERPVPSAHQLVCP
jgi:peptidoglycan/LPS O-acetylase OafA/YrhL